MRSSRSICKPTSGIEAAIISLLCSNVSEPQSPPLRQDTSYRTGLFSQLNALTEQVVERLYRGDAAGAHTLLYDVRLIGYGDGPLRQHIWPLFDCPRHTGGHAENASRAARVDWAARVVGSAPRYLLVSHVVRLLMSNVQEPRGRQEEEVHPQHHRQGLLHDTRPRYEVAVHAWRTDKLLAKGREHIPTSAIGSLAMETLRTLDRRATTPLARDAPAAGKDRMRERALVVSDDARFGAALAERLRKLKPILHVDVAAGNASVGPESREFRRSLPPSGKWQDCGGECVVPLLRHVAAMGRSAALVLNLASNFGSFVLAAWGATNGDALPELTDLDGRVQRAQLRGGCKFFCSMRWGSRAGLCGPRELFSSEEVCQPPVASPQVGACCNTTGGDDPRDQLLGCRACPRFPPVCSRMISPTPSEDLLTFSPQAQR
jgi:hypothetical protein